MLSRKNRRYSKKRKTYKKSKHSRRKRLYGGDDPTDAPTPAAAKADQDKLLEQYLINLKEINEKFGVIVEKRKSYLTDVLPKYRFSKKTIKDVVNNNLIKAYSLRDDMLERRQQFTIGQRQEKINSLKQIINTLTELVIIRGRSDPPREAEALSP